MLSRAELHQIWQQRRHLPEVHEHLLQAAFQCIRGGQIATLTALETHTGLQPEVLHTALATLQAEGRIVHDERSGSIVGAFGLSLLATPHALCLDGRDLFTWCALDAAGIPAALQAEATVRSQCWTCQAVVTIVYRAGVVIQCSQPHIHLWVSRPEAGRSVVGET